MIDGLRTDEELVQGAEDVVFGGIAAKASLKSAHSDVLFWLASLVIIIARLEGLCEV